MGSIALPRGHKVLREGRGVADTRLIALIFAVVNPLRGFKVVNLDLRDDTGALFALVCCGKCTASCNTYLVKMIVSTFLKCLHCKEGGKDCDPNTDQCIDHTDPLQFLIFDDLIGVQCVFST